MRRALPWGPTLSPNCSMTSSRETPGLGENQLPALRRRKTTRRISKGAGAYPGSKPSAPSGPSVSAELARTRASLRAALEERQTLRQELAHVRGLKTALATAETRLRLVLEAANLGFWDWEIPSNKVYHSPEWKRQLGYAEGEISNRLHEWQSRIHPDDQERVQAVVKRFMASPTKEYDVEFRLRHRNGSFRWMRSRGCLMVEGGVPVRLVGVHLDITHLKEAAEEHGRLAAIVESSNDAIIGETLDGRITSWNQSAERIYGYTADEVLGRSMRILVPRERVNDVTQILERTKRGEVIDHVETMHLRKNGKQIYVSLVVSPIRDDAGQITGASTIARDITERKQLEAEVLQISEREQQRIARDLHDGLGQLLSGTVHLTNVLQLELAEQSLPEAAEALRVTELLNQAVGEARSLAHGLYPVRPEANGLMVALQELALRTKELFKATCRFRCIREVLMTDNAMATHLYRIAQEAVTNALKHGHARRIQVGLSATSKWIRLTVRDDGRGLLAPPSQRKGMGIRIMQYRAGMMGGSLSILNRAQGGVVVICKVQR